jgi:hypothetical protein
MDDRFKSLLDSEWRMRRSQHDAPSAPADYPTPVWGYELTPAFPGEWPPTPAMTAYYYAYATRFTFSVADAAYVASPWARIRVDRDGGVNFEPLSSEIREIGLQGVRPLDGEARAAWDLSESAQGSLRQLRALPKGEEAALIRAFYRVWVNGNGRIADALRPWHRGFFQWLTGNLWVRLSRRVWPMQR